MRTEDEIVAKIAQVEEAGDPFGYMTDDLRVYLSRERLLEGLEPEKGSELDEFQPLPQEGVLEMLKSYLPFAWEKANDCRGLSAMRSLEHLKAWTWLLGREDLEKAMDNYTLYGKPELRLICESYGVDWQALDNGRWRNSEDGVDHTPFTKELP